MDSAILICHPKFLRGHKKLFLYFFLGGGGWWGWARVSDFFFTKIPDLKNKYFLRWGGEGRGLL